MQTRQRNFPEPLAPGQINVTAVNPPLLMLKRGAIKPAGGIATFTRIAAPALISGALWSQNWLGTSTSVLLALATMIALAVIARLGGRTNFSFGWASSVSFGERIWLNRLHIPVPQEASAQLTAVYLTMWSGTIVAMTGGFTTSVVLTMTGLAVAYTAMIVYFQMLVRLYQTMREKEPLYRFWTSTAHNDNTQGKRAGSGRA